MGQVKTKKRPRRGLKKSADVNVTVELYGWAGETRMFSDIDEFWAVRLEFRRPGSNNTMTHDVFQSDDYEKAFAKYQAFLKIVQD